ncbi:c-type cytochrome [Mariprofundus erugo]|uniref:c-type cytochrome n=1 Tax=Mariprofundus erugo TaxID=2528639 RepID=UPI0010FE11E1|nr:c-type cytochrome [Mariprofundus erugo]TLS77292.1 c-type cytochrome [Mariprofundus erugo]
MKLFPWFYSAAAVMLLSACSNASDTGMLSPEAAAAEKVAAIQQAMDQAIGAQKAAEVADSNRLQAEQKAEVKRAAVQEAIARAAKESEMLKKNAESKARWAAMTHAHETAAREALLQAALEQANAERLVAEKAEAVKAAMIQVEIRKEIARKAMEENIEASRQAAHVIEAERLASASIGLAYAATSAAEVAAPSTPAAVRGAPSHAGSSTSHASEKKTVVATVKHEPEKQQIAAAESRPVARVEAATRSEVAVSSQAAAAAHPVALLAQESNAERGHDLARKCTLCHALDADKKSKFGPGLYGIVGQKAGRTEGYRYSAALTQADFTWDAAKLSEWVCNSEKAVKSLTGDKQARTKMPAQHACGQDAADIVAYLSSLKPQLTVTARAD